MTFPSDALCGSFLFFPSRENRTIFFCQPTTKSPYFAPPDPAENQSQSSNLVFSSARDAREEKKINQRVVRDLRDFKMTTSDSYEPNHHTSSSRPCCSEAIVTQSSEPVCASIGEMANAPLLTAHTEKNFSFMCARPTEDSLLLLLLLLPALSYRFQIATFFSKAKKFRQINLLTFSSKI